MCIRDSAGTGEKKTLRNLHGGHFAREKQGWLLLVQGDMLYDIKKKRSPVSYTHLDVYKRQAGE